MLQESSQEHEVSMSNQPPPSSPHAPEIRVEDDRTGMDPVTLERAIIDHLHYAHLKSVSNATTLDVFKSLAYTVRDRLAHRWIETQRIYFAEDVKRVFYLSAEFLMGRALGLNLINLGIHGVVKELLAKHGVDLDELLDTEPDPGLGNGGLGRLAACFLDSMATLGLPGYGYGIRYEFGIFDQQIRDGWQVERGDAWLRYGNPWEIPRPEFSVTVNMYGHVEHVQDESGNFRVHWVDTHQIIGLPYDTPIAGHNNDTVNTLRLWEARATRDFNFQVFNDGDYRRAVAAKADSETISKVLYPNDTSAEGRELRLKQQYFFTCCSLHDIVRRYLRTEKTFDRFADKVAIQLNDTHPAVTVAELMRLLVDREGLGWDQAWDITRKTIAYTNHTLLPEALEKWDVDMFGRLLPRHLEIIYEINRRFLREVQIKYPMDDARLARMSIIAEGKTKQIRMAHLAVVGSHSVNGVAALHTDLLKENVLRDFAEMYPERFNNKTNGVTPRRWILLSNPKLSDAITKRLGPAWIDDLDQLEKLTRYVDDEEFHHELQQIKRANKLQLARLIHDRNGVDPLVDSIYDVQIKRLHEYKRQLLNCIHIVALYQDLKENPNAPFTPRTFIFGGKAAPGYAMAKLHIKLINDVAATVNADPTLRDRLKVVFVANYGVSLAQIIIPATDVSEQISMAGKEASGTGNMKFAMNGALTVGTLDGANVEIREAVGPENFFLFGLNATQARDCKQHGYRPAHYIERSPRLRHAIDLIASGFFSPDDKYRFEPIVHDLWNHDNYLVCADFDAYYDCQQSVSQTYRDPAKWLRMVVHNLANVGRFSSDRTIRQYADEIWGVKPYAVHLSR